MARRRRIIGRPLLVATAGIAAVAYACGSQVSGNLAPSDSGPPADMNASEVSGNLVAVIDAGKDQNAGDAANASDASDASDGD
jgi:hypothetical protein